MSTNFARKFSFFVKKKTVPTIVGKIMLLLTQGFLDNLNATLKTK